MAGALLLAGCSSSGSVNSSSTGSGSKTATLTVEPEVVQRDVMNFADSFVTALSETYDDMREAVKSPQLQRSALSGKLNISRAAYINAVNSNPMAGLVDMIVLVSLQRQVCEDAWFAERYGAAGDGPRATLQNFDRQVWKLAARHLTPAQLRELQAAIANWRKEHPDQHFVALVRITDFTEAKRASREGGTSSGSIFSVLFLDPFSNLGPAVRELEQSRIAANRMFFFAQRMSQLFRWQTESLVIDLLDEPQITEALQNTTRFSDASKQFAEASANFSKDVGAQLERAIVQLDRVTAIQREAAIKEFAQATATERKAALEQLASVVATARNDAIEQLAAAVERQRAMTLTDATERVGVTQKALVGDFEAAADRILMRVFWLALALIVIAVIAIAIGRYGVARSDRRVSHSSAIH